MIRYADYMARWAAIALGFSIPISVALDNVLLALTLTGWLLSGAFGEKLAVIRRHPVAVAALALFALLAIGTLYGEPRAGWAMRYLGKYSDLAFIPLFLCLFRDAAARRHAIHALAISLALVLALSYLIKLGLMPANRFFLVDPADPVVFKKHLTHNILMAFGVFLFAWLARAAASPRARLGWTGFAILALLNVLAMVPGATGYGVLAGLMLLLGFNYLGWRGLSMAVIGVGLVAGTLTAVPGPFSERMNRIVKEAREWRMDQPTQTSTGLRLQFYGNTAAIIADHPLLGVGTGGVPAAYAKKVQGTGMAATQNPHNEYLNIAAQLGIIGLAALLWLFGRQWRLTAGIATPLERELARGLVITLVLGCMFNSLLLDHTEGLLYAWLSGVLYGGLKFGNEL